MHGEGSVGVGEVEIRKQGTRDTRSITSDPPVSPVADAPFPDGAKLKAPLEFKRVAIERKASSSEVEHQGICRSLFAVHPVFIPSVFSDPLGHAKHHVNHAAVGAPTL